MYMLFNNCILCHKCTNELTGFRVNACLRGIQNAPSPYSIKRFKNALIIRLQKQLKKKI